MPNGGAKQPERMDPAIFIIILVAFFVAIALFMWFFARPVVIGLFYLVDLGQYMLLHYIHCLNGYGVKIAHYVYQVLFDHSASQIDRNSISFAELKTVQMDIGRRLFWFYALVAFYIFYRIKKDMKGAAIKSLFTIRKTKETDISFAEYQSRKIPTSGAGLDYNPEKPDPNLAPPITPFNFMMLHNIRFNRDEGIDKEALTEVFKEQLGSRWRGFHHEPFYRQALLLMFAVNLQYPLKKGKFGSLGFNNELATAFYKSGSDEDIRKAVCELIKSYIEQDPKIVPFINNYLGTRHAFSRTACVGLLGYCGPFRHWGGGFSKMLPPASYQWIQRWDRPLMLALHAVGSRGVKVYSEAAGIISHYLVEYSAGELSYDPMVEMAVESVEPYLTKELQGSAAVFDMERAKKDLARLKRGY